MRYLLIAFACLALAACGEMKDTNPSASRQANATRTAMDSADRQIGMPRIVNFSQRKLLKNAYEDMDQTVLTYVYVQSTMAGKFVCLGQAVGYGVSMGTQFTAPTFPQRIRVANSWGADSYDVYEQAQPEPNGLYMPESGAATIVNLIDSKTGVAHTALVEPDVITTPTRLDPSAVLVPCPADVDPAKVRDAKETGITVQR